MSTRIVTLFGEEIVPEQQKPAPKTRGKKKDQKDDAEDEEQAADGTLSDEAGIAAATTSPSESPAVITDQLAEAIAATAPETTEELPDALIVMATPSSYEAVTNEETPNEPEIITHPFFSMTDDDIETDGVTDTFTDIEDSSGKFITLAGAIMDTAPEYPSDIPEAMFIIATPATEQVHTEETQAILEELSATIEEEIVAETNEVVVEATIADTEEIIDSIPAEEATTVEAEVLANEPDMEVAAVVVIADAQPVAETVAITTNKRTKKAPKEEDEEYDIPAKTPADIIPEDWHGDKNYYTIGEVAEFFKVKTSHIRFWTNEFKMKVRTTRKGDRLFTPANVKELRAIYHLVKERGFTLAGAKTKLKTQNKRDVTTVDLKTSLTQLKNKLLILREQLI